MRGLTSALLLVCMFFAMAARHVSAACDVVEIGSRLFGERIRDVEVDGDHAFVAAGYHGLVILNVIDPAAPWIESVVELPGYSQDVEIDGSYAYVASSEFGPPADPPSGTSGGLYVVDILDRAAPVEIAHYGSSFLRLLVEANTVYAIDASNGLSLIDVSTPANPTLVSNLDLPGRETDLAIEGSALYMGIDDNETVRAVVSIDISNPLVPVQTQSLDMGEKIPVGLHVAGSTVFATAIGSARRGLAIQDFSGPGAPAELSFLRQPNARSVELVGSRAYFAFGIDDSYGGGTGGLRIFDVSDLANPVPIGATDTTVTETAALAVQNGPSTDLVFAAVSGEVAGLRIFEVSNCPSVESVDVIPDSSDNWIPLTLDAEIGVEIPGSATFDVASVDLNSLAFGPLLAPHLTSPGFEPLIADQNFDGRDDLRVFFQQSQSGLDEFDPQGCVEGTAAGGAFAACDWIFPNYPPQAVPVVTFSNSFVPLTVHFSATPSSDPEGDLLSFLWTFTDGASPDANENTAHLYTGYGEYEVVLSVMDSLGQVSSLPVQYTINVDSDGDAIADIDEFGADPQNPVDTDGDGTPDYLDLDSDNDGLRDDEEDLNGNGYLDGIKGNVIETDRLHPDTDLDGASDHLEVMMGTNPRDPTSYPIIATVPLVAPWALVVLAAMMAASGQRRITVAGVRESSSSRLRFGPLRS